MTYTGTRTATSSTTMTVARVREVTRKVAANLTALVTAGHVREATAKDWIDDLIYLQVKEAFDYFEFQCTLPSGERCGLHYEVRADGSVQEDSSSGGIDVYGLPAGTIVRLFAHLRPNLPPAVRAELNRRGWGSNGTAIEADHSERRAFSNGGYSLVRTKVGIWP